MKSIVFFMKESHTFRIGFKHYFNIDKDQLVYNYMSKRERLTFRRFFLNV